MTCLFKCCHACDEAVCLLTIEYVYYHSSKCVGYLIFLQDNEATFEKPGHHPKELNPYWKNGGSGLPSENASAKSNIEGRSWILRSYKRALEQANKTGISFQDIAEK